MGIGHNRELMFSRWEAVFPTLTSVTWATTLYLQMLELFPWLRFFGPQVWKDLDQLRIRYRKFYLSLAKKSTVCSSAEKVTSHY